MSEPRQLQLIHYRTNPVDAAANRAAIAAVFDDLRRLRPAGLTYRVYRRDNEFFHIYSASGDPLAGVPAFQDFLAEIRARIDGEPTNGSVELIGAYARPDT